MHISACKLSIEFIFNRHTPALMVVFTRSDAMGLLNLFNCYLKISNKTQHCLHLISLVVAVLVLVSLVPVSLVKPQCGGKQLSSCIAYMCAHVCVCMCV